MDRLEINPENFPCTNTNKEGRHVLINYKFTDKKFKLTEKENNGRLF